ncbi:MAG TPA: aminoglycoside phosphotransferase family protein [Pirellulales bacterium]|nr:aminoglycoside phosphotransferase family protein [Pirellulales bacterium]
MQLLDRTTAETYLHDSGHIAGGEPINIRELAGGVSNVVLLVEFPQQPERSFVIKQARPKLQTARPWYANVERAWREAAVLRICSELLNRARAKGLTLRATIPQVVFEDRERYLFAITAAPYPHVTWKSQLLAGLADRRIAGECGRLLGTLHAESWLDERIQAEIGDRTLFEQLRVDPYYRALAEIPDARPAVERVIASLAAHPRSLVHADFSPKNMLVFDDGLMLVDFETGHFGDPAFDLGFFLSHVVLKAFHLVPRHEPILALGNEFQTVYDQVMATRVPHDELVALWRRGIEHLIACAWARVDGKSPVEYLSQSVRERVRSFCRSIIDAPPRDWPAMVRLCEPALRG